VRSCAAIFVERAVASPARRASPADARSGRWWALLTPRLRRGLDGEAALSLELLCRALAGATLELRLQLLVAGLIELAGRRALHQRVQVRARQIEEATTDAHPLSAWP